MGDCRRSGCVLIPCKPSPACASGNHCYVITGDGFVIVRDAKDPEGKPAVFTPDEWHKLTSKENE